MAPSVASSTEVSGLLTTNYLKCLQNGNPNFKILNLNHLEIRTPYNHDTQ